MTDDILTVADSALLPHLDELKSISDRELGDGYLDEQFFRRGISLEGPEQLLVLLQSRTAEDECIITSSQAGVGSDDSLPMGHIIGFHIVATHTPETLTEYLQLDREEWPRILQEASRIGVPRTLVIRETNQQQGYGKQLFEAGLQVLINNACEAYCAVAWEAPDGVRADSLLRSSGFAPARTIDEYWKTASREEGYECLACGRPCSCRAVLYLRS